MTEVSRGLADFLDEAQAALRAAGRLAARGDRGETSQDRLANIGRLVEGLLARWPVTTTGQAVTLRPLRAGPSEMEWVTPGPATPQAPPPGAPQPLRAASIGWGAPGLTPDQKPPAETPPAADEPGVLVPVVTLTDAERDRLAETIARAHDGGEFPGVTLAGRPVLFQGLRSCAEPLTTTFTLALEDGQVRRVTWHPDRREQP